MVAVRCPAQTCGEVFELASSRLGRNVYCIRCGTRMTARPAEVERILKRRQPRSGGVGSAPNRLPFVVLADNIRSLWNVGAIFRTADACGIERVVLAGITGCPPRPEIAKTALGADQTVAWNYEPDPVSAVQSCRQRGYLPIALEESAAATPIAEMVWPDRVCLVIGNEVGGVTPPVLEQCADQVSIPMRGVKQSLNVAVAFGIAAYAAASALAATCSVPVPGAPE